MLSRKFKKPTLTLSTVLLAVLIAICLAKFAANITRTLQSTDSGWLIRTGLYIIEHGLPTNDPFSWTSPDRPLIIYQWLYAVILGFIWQQGGLWLVGLTTSIVVSLIYIYCLPTTMINRGVKAVYAFALLSLCCSPVFFWARPQITSFVLILVFTAILDKTRENSSTKQLWFLPPLMVLWANLHSFWFIGLGMVAAYLMGALKKKDSVRTKTLALTLLVCCGAVLINPYGIKLIEYNLSFTTQPDFGSIRELQPLLFTQAKFHLPELLYLILAWSALLIGRRSVPLAGLLLGAAGTSAALCFYRFLPIAILLTWPYVSMALASFSIFKADESDLTAAPKNWRILKISLACLAVVSSIVFYTQQYPFGKPVWFSNSDSNQAVTVFLKDHPDLTKRLLCDPAVGCSLIYENILPVFFDTRFDFYGQQFCSEFNSCWNAEVGWQQYLEKWHVLSLCVDDSYPIYKALLVSANWRVAYDDKLFSVWLPATIEKKDKTELLAPQQSSQ